LVRARREWWKRRASPLPWRGAARRGSKVVALSAGRARLVGVASSSSGRSGVMREEGEMG
jgi:hypothetical protein